MAKYHKVSVGLLAARFSQLAVFQLFYEGVRLSLSTPKPLRSSCQNFLVNSFSHISIATLCHGRCEEF